MITTLSSKTFTVKAGTTVRKNITGAIFMLESATLPVDITFDSKELLEAVKPGYRFKLLNGDHFKTIDFANRNAGDISITFYAGNGDSDTLNTLLKPAPTVGLAVDLAGNTLVNGASVAIPQVNNGFARKEFTISNLTNATLQLLDSAGKIYMAVLPMSQICKTTCGAMTLKNASGIDAVGVYIGCEYYS